MSEDYRHCGDAKKKTCTSMNIVMEGLKDGNNLTKDRTNMMNQLQLGEFRLFLQVKQLK